MENSGVYHFPIKHQEKREEINKKPNLHLRRVQTPIHPFIHQSQSKRLPKALTRIQNLQATLFTKTLPARHAKSSIHPASHEPDPELNEPKATKHP
jgi:hypothetical protein